MPPLSQRDPNVVQDQYASWQSLANRYDALGNPTPGKVTRRLNRLSRFLPEGVDPTSITGIDFGGQFNLSEANALRNLSNQVSGKIRRPGAYNKQNEQLLTENTLQEGRDRFASETDPMLQQGVQSLSDLASKPAFGEDYLTRARSSLASTIKGAEQDRLRRVSAVLGLRGLDPSSPAGAALATRTALDSDAEIARQFSGLQQGAIEGNQAAQRTNATLLSQLALSRETANRAATQGDLETLSRVNNDISGILEAVRAQRELEAYQNAQAREAGSHYWTDQAMSGLKAGIGAAGMALSGGATGLAGGMASGAASLPYIGGARTSGGNYSPTGGYQGVDSYQSPAYNYAAPRWTY